MVLPTHITKEKPNNGKNSSFNIEEPNSKTRIWYHWLNIRFRQYMILEILLIFSLIMIFYKLQTISNQNNQVIEMVSSINSRMIILEEKIISGKSIENSKPPEQPINDVKKSKTEELITTPVPIILSNNDSNVPKKGLILNAADYLRGASVDIAHSSSSNLNPIIGYDQTNLVLLDRPQPPTHKAWCSNEHNPVLTINLAKYIRPISVSYQHSKWTHDIPMSTPKTYDVVACLDFYCENWKPLVSNCKYSSQSIGTEQFCNISSFLNVPLIGKVQFRFKENYGDSKMTCVHLVRVYGETDKPVQIEERKKSLKSEETCADVKYYYHNSYYFKYTLVNKSCSVVYKNDCCSDCPECCEECLISDLNGNTPFFQALFTFLGIILLFGSIVLIAFIIVVFSYWCSPTFRQNWNASR